MNDVMFSIALIFAATLITSVSLKTGVPYKLGKIAQPLMEKCEAKLPRNEVCELIAVPKRNKHD